MELLARDNTNLLPTLVNYKEPTLEWSNKKVLHLDRSALLKIRLSLKSLPGTNTLAYSENSTKTDKKVL
jgi:hypothetical protein